MDPKKIEKLLELIGELVNSGKAWTEKRDAILAEAGDDDRTNLTEFSGWFN